MYLPNGKENTQERVCELCGALVVGNEPDPKGGEDHTASECLLADWRDFMADPAGWIVVRAKLFEPELTLERIGGLLRNVRKKINRTYSRQAVEFRLSHLEQRLPAIKHMLRRRGKALL